MTCGRHEKALLAAVLFFSLMLRVYALSQEEVVFPEGIFYSRLGKNIIQYGRYQFGENFNRGIVYPPGLPILIGLSNVFLNDLKLAGEVVSVISSLATVFLFYLIGRRLYGWESGLFAALAYGCYPFMSRYGVQILSEPAFMMFFALSIYLYMKTADDGSMTKAMMLGASMSLAYLTRPEGIALLILPLLYLRGGKDPSTVRRVLLRMAVSYVVFIAISSPYILFLKNELGGYAITGKHRENLFLSLGGVSGKYVFCSLNEGKTQLLVRDYEKPTLGVVFDAVSEKPLEISREIIKKAFGNAFLLAVLTAPVALPLCFSMYPQGLRTDKRLLAALGIIAGIVFVTFSVHAGLAPVKYMYTIISIAILVSSIGYSTAPAVLERLYAGKPGCGIIKRNIKAAMLVILLSSTMVYYSKDIYIGQAIREMPAVGGVLDEFRVYGDIDYLKRYMKLGLFVKNNLSSAYEEVNIMGGTTGPYVAFYGDARLTELPCAPVEDAIQFGRGYGVDYIVFQRGYGTRDCINDPLDSEKFAGSVEKVYEDAGEEFTLRMYRLKKES